MEIKDNLETLVETLKHFIDFIEPFKPLLNTHNVNFIVENHWQNENILPSRLRDQLNRFIDKCIQSKQPINLVKHYKSFMSNSSSNASSDDEHQLVFYSRLKECIELWERNVIVDVDRFLAEFFDHSSDLIEYNRRLEEKFSIIERENRFMNEKKSYEVDTMSKFVANLCKKFDIKTIVEIGSGRAYLSAQLSSKIFENELNTIAIDSSESNVQSSLKRLNTMKRQTSAFSNKKPDDNNSSDINNRFKTFSQFIESTSELHALIDQESSSSSSSEYALIGLHCCGNLSNSIVNLYLNNTSANKCAAAEQRQVKLLCNVSCCYNLLNEKYANDVESSKDLKRTNVAISESSKFPMSAYLNNAKYFLNFNVRMLACHSLDRCLQSIDDFKELNDVSLWYRCVLQLILSEKFSDSFKDTETTLSSVQVGRNLMKSSSIDFRAYVRKALEKLNLKSEKITDEEIDEFLNKHESLTKPKFTAFTQLKLILSPIIEFIILLDRFIYMSEHNYEHNYNKYRTYLIRLFDAARSPRCYALVSYLK